jgi:hypothetical protein
MYSSNSFVCIPVRSYAVALFLIAHGRHAIDAVIVPPGIAAFRFNDQDVAELLPVYRIAKAHLESLETAARGQR